MTETEIEKFITTNSKALEVLATVEKDKTKPVLDVLDNILDYFKGPDAEKLNDTIAPIVSVAYSEYVEARNCFIKGNEESALYHAQLARAHFSNETPDDYKLVGSEFLVFVFVGSLAIKFGIFEIANASFAELDSCLDSESKKNFKLENLRDFCGASVDYFDYLKRFCGRGAKVEEWLKVMIGYWYFIVNKPGKVKTETNLKAGKNLYGLWRMESVDDPEFQSKKAIVSDLMRYTFGGLIKTLNEQTLKNDPRHNLVYCELKGDLARREIEKKLDSIDAFLKEVNEDDYGFFGFLIILTSGVAYQLINKYDRALDSFKRARETLAKLEDPFKSFLENLDFVSFESQCKTKYEEQQERVRICEKIENPNPKDARAKQKKTNRGAKQKKPKQKVVAEATKGQEVEEKHEGEAHEKSNPEVRAIDAKDKDDVKHEIKGHEAEKDTKKVKSTFDWDFESQFEYDLNDDYNYAKVKRPVDNGVHGEYFGKVVEEGTLIRYRDLSKANKELGILLEIERLCPEGGSQFVLRAKPPIYEQRVVMEGCEEVQVYDFVVERGIPFAWWLEEQKKIFRGHPKEEQTKQHWWKFIEKDIKRLFRGVVRGLWVLYSARKPFLGFHKGMGIFVCGSGTNSYCKIKPCVDDDDFDFPIEDEVRDVRGLKQILRWAIEFPFDSNDQTTRFDALGEEYSLDLEMRMCFDTINETGLYPVKYNGVVVKTPLIFDYIVDAPFFWTKQEKIGFLFKYGELIERKLLPRNIRNHVCFNPPWYKIFGGLGEVGEVETLGEGETVKDEFCVFGEIFKRQQLVYSTPLGVVRFSVNTLKHYNAKEYKKKRSKTLKDVEIESLLSKLIPSLYCALVKSIFLGQKNPLFQWDQRDVCVKELLSRCFSKGECDNPSCPPYKACNHLLE